MSIRTLPAELNNPPVPIIRGVDGKSDIFMVGSCYKHNGVWQIHGWRFDGGTYERDGKTVCGYLPEELEEICKWYGH